MSLYLGLDTSNYRTSAAVFDSALRKGYNLGKLLPVAEGALGLRQSDAVFAHIRQLPRVVESVLADSGSEYAAVSASVSPRTAEDSYMPCFLVGETAARVVSSVMKIPFHGFSHQQGHIAAAAYSADCLSLLNCPFIAWHLSGGTTELLLVEPDEVQTIRCRRIGGTTDIAAGQLIDRAGVLLGLAFPAGPELEKLAEGHTEEHYYRVRVNNCCFSLSGVENKVKTMLASGAAPADAAYYVLRTVLYTVHTATSQAVEKFPGVPILCSGGVMSNAMIRDSLRDTFRARCASIELAGDNALGSAILGWMKQEGGL